MAEHVQAALDQMVEPLQDLQDRGVFSVDEIRAVVNRRRDSEYALRRRATRKADFLRYLQAEMDLEQLRQLRSKRLLKEKQQEELKNKGSKAATAATAANNNTKHAGDKHIIQLLHLLWVRTLRKYRADVSLYLQYADFCKQAGSFRRLGRVYAEALQMHPKVPGLWIEAASHEFFQSGSIPAARVLLQRAIRINATADSLWLQYFGLELHFIQKMQGRRAILMGGDANKDNDDKDDDKDKDEDTTEQWDAYRMPTLVYDNAIKAIPDSVAFRLQFLDQCRLFPNTEKMQAHIVDTIRRDCEGQPEAWIARAMYAWEKSKSLGNDNDSSDELSTGFVRTEAVEQEAAAPLAKRRRKGAVTAVEEHKSSNDPVVAVLEGAVEALETQDMYLQAIEFTMSYLEQLQSGKDDEDSDSDAEDSSDKEERIEAVHKFVKKLLKDAAALGLNSFSMVLAHVDYLESCDKTSDAIKVLAAFVESTPGDKVPATVWTKWASLVSPRSMPTAIGILKRATKQVPMTESDHMVVLLELLGATLLADDAGVADPSDCFQRILLLAPGFAEMNDIESPHFGINNVSSACLIYLRHKTEAEGVAGARSVYHAVLFQSSVGKALATRGDEAIKAFVDEAIATELDEKAFTTKAKNALRRLFDEVVEMFADTPLAGEYRRSRDAVVVYSMDLTVPSTGVAGSCLGADTSPISIPSFDVAAPGFDSKQLSDAFEKYQVVHLRNPTKQMDTGACFSWEDVGQLFKQLNANDRESWCFENGGGSLTAAKFLQPKTTKVRAYCSFLVQKDKVTYQKTLNQLPLQDLEGTQWHYEPALWVFFGRNPTGNSDLEGRPEHTDSVSHDGTWHYQLSGTKEWYLRPAPRLMKLFQRTLSPKEFKSIDETIPVRLDCKEGDVIVINTRAWFHRTIIPAQESPSVSYARDFRLTEPTGATDCDGMTNVDGLYATKDIEAGFVIFTENTAPECELHRSSVNPNCEVVELEDGMSAVVSKRAIPEGEFFCVAESSSEAEESSDDESLVSEDE